MRLLLLTSSTSKTAAEPVAFQPCRHPRFPVVLPREPVFRCLHSRERGPHVRRVQGGDERSFPATGRFADDEGGGEGMQPDNKGGDPLWIVADTPRGAPVDGDIKAGFRDSDPNV